MSYPYDPEGNRTARLVDDTIDATWTWDTITGLPTRTAQYDAAGNPSTQWLPDPLTGSGTAIAAVHDAGGQTWLLTDPFGNLRDTTTTGAQLTAADPFGAPPAGGDSTVAGLGFAGQYLDQVTGLYDLRFRDYDPGTGRFTATDPVTAPVGMPALTGFAYAANTPLMLSDPTGAWPDWLDDTGTAMKGVGLGALDTVSWIGRFLWIGTNAEANAELQASLSEANEQGGAWLVVNQFNPVYSLLENTTSGWELAQQGCVEESARAFTHSTFDVAGTVGLAAGSASMARSLGPDTAAANTAGEVAGSARGPSFVVKPNGETVVVPQGASGPVPTRGDGFQFTGGSGGNGLHPSVSDVRIMDPVLEGKYAYPNGYVSYLNSGGQTINPFTGQTLGKSSPWWHWRFE